MSEYHIYNNFFQGKGRSDDCFDMAGRDMASNNDNEVITSLATEVTQQNG